ncbi:hypothetical protein D3C87_1669130 [compost metagenome]
MACQAVAFIKNPPTGSPFDCQNLWMWFHLTISTTLPCRAKAAMNSLPSLGADSIGLHPSL